MEPLTLSFGFSPKSTLVYELAEAFFLHVLYVRNILPEPYDSLRREFATVAPEDKLKYSERKKVITIEYIGEVLHHLRLLTARAHVERVAVLLGPSANNPKETYTIDFHPQTITAQNDVISVKQLAQAKRHLIHKMIEHQSTEECAPSQKTNVFVAFQMREDSLANMAEPEVQDAVSIFSFKDAFKIKDESGTQTTGTKRAFGGRKRVKPFHLHIVSRSSTVDRIPNVNVEGTSTIVSEEDGTNGIPKQSDPVHSPQNGGARWLVLSKGIKSFPL
eukprot:gene7554-9051_t